MVLGPQYGSARPCVSISEQSICFVATIVIIAAVLAIAGWPNDGNLTSVINDTIALRRIWYALSKFQKKASCRSCKMPQNHHQFHCHHHHFCPPCRRWKKLTLIAPLNNDKCPGEQIFFLSLTSHQHNAWLWNGRLLWPSPNFEDDYGNTIFPTCGRTVSYRSSTWQMGNSEIFPSGLCLPFLPSHFMCRTRLIHWLNFTIVFIAPLLITLKTVAIHPTSSILSPPKTASPSAMRSHLLPPPWLICSQTTAA
jgi:hypothetical protein